MTEEEEIQKCLHCPFSDCYNCLEYGHEEIAQRWLESLPPSYKEFINAKHTYAQRRLINNYCKALSDTEIAEKLGMMTSGVRNMRSRIGLPRLPDLPQEVRLYYMNQWKQT